MYKKIDEVKAKVIDTCDADCFFDIYSEKLEEKYDYYQGIAVFEGDEESVEFYKKNKLNVNDTLIIDVYEDSNEDDLGLRYYLKPNRKVKK